MVQQRTRTLLTMRPLQAVSPNDVAMGEQSGNTRHISGFCESNIVFLYSIAWEEPRFGVRSSEPRSSVSRETQAWAGSPAPGCRRLFHVKHGVGFAVLENVVVVAH